MTSLLTKTLIGLLVVAGSCSTVDATPTAPPLDGLRSASGPTSMPDLCSIDEGRHCEPCGGPTLPLCPQGDSGALCCSQGVCVIWSGSTCSGTLGWCNNYTTTRENGIITATCHDGSGG